MDIAERLVDAGKEKIFSREDEKSFDAGGTMNSMALTLKRRISLSHCFLYTEYRPAGPDT